MTRDEAIELLQSRVGKGISENEFNELKYLVNEPKLHKVAEEGLPTEEGWYVCRVDWSRKPFVILKYEDRDWWLDYDEPISNVIAWQRIEPYEKEV